MRFQASANPALGKQTWELTTQGANGRFLQTASAWKARCRLAHVVSRAVPLRVSSPANVPSGALRCYSWLPPAWTEGRRTCPLPRARHHHHCHHHCRHVIVTAAATTADAQGALAPSNHCAGYFNHVFAVNSQNIPQDKWIRISLGHVRGWRHFRFHTAQSNLIISTLNLALLPVSAAAGAGCSPPCRPEARGIFGSSYAPSHTATPTAAPRPVDFAP